jgi:hypothetical protein
MRVETYACDICGTQKKDANRWWKIRIYSVPNPKTETEPLPVGSVAAIVIQPWAATNQGGIETTTRLQENNGTIHLCGEQCVMQYVSQVLAK